MRETLVPQNQHQLKELNLLSRLFQKNTPDNIDPEFWFVSPLRECNMFLGCEKRLLFWLNLRDMQTQKIYWEFYLKP